MIPKSVKRFSDKIMPKQGEAYAARRTGGFSSTGA